MVNSIKIKLLKINFFRNICIRLQKYVNQKIICIVQLTLLSFEMELIIFFINLRYNIESTKVKLINELSKRQNFYVFNST
jgi:hypothetical protein